MLGKPRAENSSGFELVAEHFTVKGEAAVAPPTQGSALGQSRSFQCKRIDHLEAANGRRGCGGEDVDPRPVGQEGTSRGGTSAVLVGSPAGAADSRAILDER